MNSRSGLILVLSRPMFSVRGLRPTAIRIFSASIFCCFAVDRNRDRDARFCFFDFVDLRAGVEIDSALAVDAREFLRDFFVFDRNQTRKHFDDGHFAIERTVDRGELNSDSSGTHDHQ